MNEKPNESMRVDACEGKYTVIQDKQGHLRCLRYGQEWRDLGGDGMVCALASDLDEERKKTEKLQNEVEWHRKFLKDLGLKPELGVTMGDYHRALDIARAKMK